MCPMPIGKVGLLLAQQSYFDWIPVVMLVDIVLSMNKWPCHEGKLPVSESVI